MPFVFKRVQKVVAAFIIIALFLLIAVIVLIGKGSGLFERKDTYVTYLTSGHGVSSGQVITYKETPVGKVQKVELTSDDNIRITVSIERKYSYKLIHKDSVLKISGGGLLGGGGVMLISRMDTNAPFLQPGSMIFSSDMKEGQVIIAEYERNQPKDDLMAKVDEILSMVANLDPLITSSLANVRDATGSLAKILGGLAGTDYSVVSSQLISSLSKLNSIMDSLDSTMANVNNMTESDLQQIMLLLKEDLIELKKVMQNLPFGIGTGTSTRPNTIQGGDRQ